MLVKIDTDCLGDKGIAVSLECSSILIASAKGHGSRKCVVLTDSASPARRLNKHLLLRDLKQVIWSSLVLLRAKNKVYILVESLVRRSGFFNIQTNHGAVQGVSYKHYRFTQHSNGYNLNYGAAIPPTTDPKNSVAVSLPNF